MRSSIKQIFDRVLVMPLPNPNIEIAAEGYFQMAKEVVEDRLMVEVHLHSEWKGGFQPPGAGKR